MIGIAIALIVVGLSAMVAMVYSQSNTVRRIEVHNASVDHYDSEIDQIIARMDQITADIAELNKEHISDHKNLVDIRMRYINYRTPVQSNGGVDWAPEFPSQEDL